MNDMPVQAVFDQTLHTLAAVANPAAANINTFQVTRTRPRGRLSPSSALLFIMKKNVQYAIGSSIMPNIDVGTAR